MLYSNLVFSWREDDVAIPQPTEHFSHSVLEISPVPTSLSHSVLEISPVPTSLSHSV